MISLRKHFSQKHVQKERLTGIAPYATVISDAVFPLVMTSLTKVKALLFNESHVLFGLTL
jgi:hypothetical protein